MSLTGPLDFFFFDYELSNLCRKQLLPPFSVLPHLRGNNNKKNPTINRRARDLLHPTSSFLPLSSSSSALEENISMATGHRATIPPGMHAARLIH